MTETLWGSDPNGTNLPIVAFTRPNNATPYTAGDVVGTDPGAVMEFQNCARVPGLGGMITRVTLIDGANQAAKLSAELWLFSTAPAAATDNAAFAPSTLELANLVAIVPLSTSYVGKADAGANGNVVLISDVASKVFRCGGSTRSLYGVLVARSAYTPVAQEAFRVQLDIVQG